MFAPFTCLTSRAAVLPQANIDTDIIIRIERLTTGDPARIGDYALEALRYREDGSENPEFPLNQPRWRDARILIAGANFGCGSSREPAVTALIAMGLRCIIAESFGDIFYANCFQNGMLPIRLPAEDTAALMADAEASSSDFVVDLHRCMITTAACREVAFTIDPQRRQALLSGLDDIGLTLRHSEAITAWQHADHARRPWIWMTDTQEMAA